MSETLISPEKPNRQKAAKSQRSEEQAQEATPAQSEVTEAQSEKTPRVNFTLFSSKLFCVKETQSIFAIPIPKSKFRFDARKPSLGNWEYPF